MQRMWAVAGVYVYLPTPLERARKEAAAGHRMWAVVPADVSLSFYLPAAASVYLLTYLPTYLPTYLLTYLPTYLFTYLPACPPLRLSTYLPADLWICRAHCVGSKLIRKVRSDYSCLSVFTLFLQCNSSSS